MIDMKIAAFLLTFGLNVLIGCVIGQEEGPDLNQIQDPFLFIIVKNEDRTKWEAGEEVNVEVTVKYVAPAYAYEKKGWIGIVPSKVPHGDERVNDDADKDFQHFRRPWSMDMIRDTMILRASLPVGCYDVRMFDSDSKDGKELASVTFKVGEDGNVKVGSNFRLTKVVNSDRVICDSGTQDGWIYWEGNPKWPVTITWTGELTGTDTYRDYNPDVDEENKRIRLDCSCTGYIEPKTLSYQVTMTDADGCTSTIPATVTFAAGANTPRPTKKWSIERVN